MQLCRLSKVLERYRGRLTDTLRGVVKTVLLEYLDMADYQQPQGAPDGLLGADEGGEQRADGSGSGALTSPSALGGGGGGGTAGRGRGRGRGQEWSSPAR